MYVGYLFYATSRPIFFSDSDDHPVLLDSQPLFSEKQDIQQDSQPFFYDTQDYTYCEDNSGKMEDEKKNDCLLFDLLYLLFTLIDML